MINHISSLLSNKSPEAQITAVGFPVDYRYSPIDFPEPIQSIRKIIFGVKPDAAMLDYRTWECLKAISSSPFLPLLDRYDDRNSYRELLSRSVLLSYKPSLVPISSLERPAIIGSPADPTIYGGMACDAMIAIAGGVATVTMRKPSNMPPYTVNFGSDPLLTISIAGTGYSVVVAQANGQSGLFGVLLKPQSSLIDLVPRLEQAGYDALSYLFEPKEDMLSEDVALLKNLKYHFFYDRTRCYVLDAIIGALVIQSEYVRNANG